jgi:glyoxylase-like metal-dependent hydrolase (beta-lactamase superfamily II)
MSKAFEKIFDNDSLELLRLETDPFGTNAYILTCKQTGESVLIDAPGNADLIENKLKGKKVLYILITHGHMDHVMALEELSGTLQAPVAVHSGDAGGLPVEPEKLLVDGDVLDCGRLKIEVLHAPGHTPGSVCLKTGDILISGDTLFPGGPGKTGSPESFASVIASIKSKILTLPDETIIIPGHGASTTVGTERPAIEAFLNRGYDKTLCGDVTW